MGREVGRSIASRWAGPVCPRLAPSSRPRRRKRSLANAYLGARRTRCQQHGTRARWGWVRRGWRARERRPDRNALAKALWFPCVGAGRQGGPCGARGRFADARGARAGRPRIGGQGRRRAPRGSRRSWPAFEFGGGAAARGDGDQGLREASGRAAVDRVREGNLRRGHSFEAGTKGLRVVSDGRDTIKVSLIPRAASKGAWEACCMHTFEGLVPSNERGSRQGPRAGCVADGPALRSSLWPRF